MADLGPGWHAERYDVGAAHGQRRRTPSLGQPNAPGARRAVGRLARAGPIHQRAIDEGLRAVAVEKSLRLPLAGRGIESGLASGHVGEPIGLRGRKAQALLQAGGSAGCSIASAASRSTGSGARRERLLDPYEAG